MDNISNTWYQLPLSLGLQNYFINKCGDLKMKCDKELVSSFLDESGYYSVVLETKVFQVHKLLAETFILNPNNMLNVLHRDGNTKNNDLNNLYWTNLKRLRSRNKLREAKCSGRRKIVGLDKLDKEGNIICSFRNVSEAAASDESYNINTLRTYMSKHGTNTFKYKGAFWKKTVTFDPFAERSNTRTAPNRTFFVTNFVQTFICTNAAAHCATVNVFGFASVGAGGISSNLNNMVIFDRK